MMSEDLQHMDFSKEDVVSHGAIKWCPGCGNFSILSAVHQALPEVGVKLENLVFVSGIGCSSRFTYYVDSYGFHGIHGRATAVATGIKLANPELSVWITTGDGDALAIGGNHLMHILRRNLDINIILFNNKIYGLTKGQFSPTSPKGLKTKTSPGGVIEEPINVGELAIGVGATFFARVIDSDTKMLKQVLIEAAKHKGTALIEVLQNCVIFADNIHQDISDKENRKTHTIVVEDKKPLLFGSNNEFGLRLNGAEFQIVRIGEDGIAEKDIYIHDATAPNKSIHFTLAGLSRPNFPFVLGILRKVSKDTFEDKLNEHVDYEQKKSPIKNMDELLQSGNIIQL